MVSEKDFCMFAIFVYFQEKSEKGPWHDGRIETESSSCTLYTVQYRISIMFFVKIAIRCM